MTEINKALFLDRDGVVNRKAPTEDRYIESVHDVVMIEGVAEAIKFVRDLGYLVIVITNQRGITLGRMTREAVDEIHAHINQYLEERGTKIDVFYVCPHDKDVCECRKPKPGLILQAVQDLNIDLSKSYLIGDRSSDIEAGRAAGIPTAHLHLSKTDSSMLPVIREILRESLD